MMFIICAYLSFVCLLYKNVFSSVLPNFWLGYLSFYCFKSIKCSLYILDIRPISGRWLENIFTNSLSCLFTFLMVSLEEQNIFLLMKSLFIFWFLPVLLISYLRYHYLIQDHKDLLIFSSRGFIILPLTFRFMIHFELFCVWCEVQVHFVVIVEKTVLSHWQQVLATLLKIINYKCKNLFLNSQFFSTLWSVLPFASTNLS